MVVFWAQFGSITGLRLGGLHTAERELGLADAAGPCEDLVFVLACRSHAPRGLEQCATECSRRELLFLMGQRGLVSGVDLSVRTPENCKKPDCFGLRVAGAGGGGACMDARRTSSGSHNL